MKKSLKIFLASAACAVLAVAAVLGSLQIYRSVRYRELNSVRHRVLRNPGLNTGAIPQGLTYNGDDNCIATSANSKRGGGRIYTISLPGGKKTHRYDVLSGGQPLMEHIGGLQYLAGKYYLAVEGVGLYVFDASLLDGSARTVEVGEPHVVNNNASFVWSDGVNLLVGEFNNNAQYSCTHIVKYGEMENHAIATMYRPDDLEHPVMLYSIPDYVQGMCILPSSNTLVISTSWGTRPSRFLIYRIEDMKYVGTMGDDRIPVVFLGAPGRMVEGPSMSEDLDIVGDMVICHSEAASNKYVFGKFFFDYGIYTLSLEDFNGKDESGEE